MNLVLYKHKRAHMNNEYLNILVIEGTTRPGRKSIHAAKFVAEIGNSIEGVNITLVDPVELNLPGDGNNPEVKDAKYSELTKNADAFFIVTPEYNHSFPGSLKRLLDSELENYIHKPTAVAGVSSGMWGGVRAVEHLVPVLREIGMVPTFTDVYFQNSYDLFKDDGTMVDEKLELYTKSVKKAYAELIWMTKTLKYGRDNIKPEEI
jgi:NAD(P)H-dependent FMN reductase